MLLLLLLVVYVAVVDALPDSIFIDDGFGAGGVVILARMFLN